MVQMEQTVVYAQLEPIRSQGVQPIVLCARRDFFRILLVQTIALCASPACIIILGRRREAVRFWIVFAILDIRVLMVGSAISAYQDCSNH